MIRVYLRKRTNQLCLVYTIFSGFYEEEASDGSILMGLTRYDLRKHYVYIGVL